MVLSNFKIFFGGRSVWPLVAKCVGRKSGNHVKFRWAVMTSFMDGFGCDIRQNDKNMCPGEEQCFPKRRFSIKSISMPLEEKNYLLLKLWKTLVCNFKILFYIYIFWGDAPFGLWRQKCVEQKCGNSAGIAVTSFLDRFGCVIRQNDYRNEKDAPRRGAEFSQKEYLRKINIHP